MPIHLYYTPTTSSILREALLTLEKKYPSAKIRPPFKMVTPDLECKEDIEKEWITLLNRKGILNDGWILTRQEFYEELLRTHFQPLPLATWPQKKQALFQALKKVPLPYQPAPEHFQAILFEFSLYHRLLSGIEKKHSKNALPSLFREYQNQLVTKFHAWSFEGQAQAALNHLLEGNAKSLQGIKEIYLLGFRQLDVPLLQLLSTLTQMDIPLSIHLFLPPPENLIDPGGNLFPLLKKLHTLPIASQEKYAPPTPKLILNSHPTPWHEWKYLEWFQQNATANSRILLTHPKTWSRFIDPTASSGSGPLIKQILKRLPSGENSKENINFENFSTLVNPILFSIREQLIADHDLASIRGLELFHHRWMEWQQAESIIGGEKTFRAWRNELAEELALVPSLFSRRELAAQNIRPLNHMGINLSETVLIPGLIEGDYPFQPPLFLLSQEEKIKDVLNHEAKLTLHSAISTASQVIFSYSEFSLSGQSQTPSPLLASLKHIEFKDILKVESQLISGKNIYFEENIRRESVRHHQNDLNVDSGNLTALNLQPLLLKKLSQRPLSASYIDDYAKCPFRFFAKWHLGLEEKKEMDLEVEPTLRGRLLHSMLEKSFQSLQTRYFEQHQTPHLADLSSLIKQLEVKLQQCCHQEEVLQKLPPILLENFKVTILKIIENLLHIELEILQESNQKMFPKHLEWNFGKKGGPKVDFPLNEETSIPLSGAIDRIDLSHDQQNFLLIDYKSSSTEEMSRQLRDQKSFQMWLYLYACQKTLFKNAQPIGALYWDLKSLKKKQGMVVKERFKPFTPQKLLGKSFMKEEEFGALQKNLEASLRVIFQKILKGDYSLNPPACLGNRCELSEICRYEEKPN